MRCGGIFDVDRRRRALADLESQAAEPHFWNSQDTARKIIDETNAHRAVLQPFDQASRDLEDAALLLELAEEEPGSVSKTTAMSEANEQLDKCEAVVGELEMRSLLSGRFDSGHAYLSLNAGAGGTESCDWADILFRMYKR